MVRVKMKHIVPLLKIVKDGFEKKKRNPSAKGGRVPSPSANRICRMLMLVWARNAVREAPF